MEDKKQRADLRSASAEVKSEQLKGQMHMNSKEKQNMKQEMLLWLECLAKEDIPSFHNKFDVSLKHAFDQLQGEHLLRVEDDFAYSLTKKGRKLLRESGERFKQALQAHDTKWGKRFAKMRAMTRHFKKDGCIAEPGPIPCFLGCLIVTPASGVTFIMDRGEGRPRIAYSLEFLTKLDARIESKLQ